jgi:hypothetical protein
LKWTARCLVNAVIFAAAAVSIAGCSTVSYQGRTGVVHAPTLQQMENDNMDRGAPILIRIYKEERTLESGNRIVAVNLRCCNRILSANFLESSARRSLKGITKRPRDFTTSLRPN